MFLSFLHPGRARLWTSPHVSFFVNRCLTMASNLVQKVRDSPRYFFRSCSDESFTNADLGNCLDYSSNPSNNLLPGTVNYKRLASMYGTVDGSRRLRRERSSSRSSDRRILSEDLRLEYHEAIAEIEQLAVRRGLREGDLASLWEMIEDSPRGSSYARSLGDDFEIQVYVLHTLPKN